jgi:hypothetical protein
MSRNDYIFGGLTLLFAIFFWEAYSKTADDFSFRSFSFSWTILSLILYLTCVSVLLLMTRRRMLFVGVFAASLLPIPLFFIISMTTITFVLLGAVAASIAYGRTKNEIETRIKATVYGPLRTGLPIILTSLSLLLASLYYSSTVQSFDIKGEDLVPKQLYNWLLHTSYGPKAVESILPGFKPDETVDDYLIHGIEKETGAKFNSLPPEQQQSILEEARKQIFNEFEIEVTGKEHMGDVFYKAMAARGNILVEPYKNLFPLAFAIALFFFLRTVASPFGVIVTFASWGIIELLTKFGLVGMSQEQKVKQELIWK